MRRAMLPDARTFTKGANRRRARLDLPEGSAVHNSRWPALRGATIRVSGEEEPDLLRRASMVRAENEKRAFAMLTPRSEVNPAAICAPYRRLTLPILRKPWKNAPAW
jgi:hypothetical protein